MVEPSRMGRYELWVSRWLFAGVVLFLAGFFAVPDNNAHRVIFYSFILLPTLVGAPLLYRFVRQNCATLSVPILCVVALFVPVFWSPDYGEELVDDKFKAALYIILWMLSVAYVISVYPEKCTGALKVLVCVALIAAIYIVWDRYSTDWNFSRTLITDWRYYNQNRMAKCFALVFFMSLWLIYAGAKNIPERLLYTFSACVFLGVVLLSKSSGALGAVVLALPAMFFLLFREKLNLIWVAAFVLLVSALFGVLWLNGNLEHHFNGGWSRRDIIWLAIWEDFLKTPWFGQGLLGFVRVVASDGHSYGHEHSLFFALLRHSGVFGCVVFAILIGQLALGTITSDKSIVRLWLAILVLGLIGSLSTGKYPLERPTEDWIFVWVPAAFLLGFLVNRQKKRETHGN